MFLRRLSKTKSILVAFVIITMTNATFSQNTQATVVFIEERSLQMAAVTDNGPDGLTRLASLFQQQGATTSFIRLDDPIPETAQVVVLVRPRTPLSPLYLTRIWLHLENGGSLLLALDAPGHGNPDTQNGGVDRLLTWEYGIRLLNGMIIAPWFTNDNVRLNNLRQSMFYAHPTTIDHIITEPHRAYDLPIMTWGARNLHSEFFAPFGSASALIEARNIYAETNRNVYLANDPAPLTVNIGTDYQGDLTIGAVAENGINNSRIAVIGDSEIFQNGFGLANIPNTQTPLHPGNYVLSQHLVSWLLHRPPEDWQPLPSDFTWLSIDGSDEDWQNRGAITQDETQDISITRQDIEQVRSFRNQDYLYLLIETVAPPDPVAAQLIISLGQADDGTARQLSLSLHESVITEGDREISIPDTRFAVAEFIEARIPLRITDGSGIVAELCLSTAREVAFPVEPDCIQNVAAPLINEREPSDLQIPDTPLATIQSTVTFVNVRSGPGTEFDVIGTLGFGQIAAIVGRNASGDWLRVQTARYDGWISRIVAQINTDDELLPVIESNAIQ